MKISNQFSHWFIALIIVIIFSISATIVQAKIVQTQEAVSAISNADSQPIYGQDGKPDGQMLDTTPIKITHDYIYYNDRVLGRYYYDSQAVDYTVETLNMVYDWVPDNINKYFMAAPTRIVVEENIDTNDQEDSIKAMEEICSKLNSGIYKINTLDTLSAHADEYIFFRTDKAWTALGSYYAAKEFLWAKNIEIVPLENYYDNMNKGYVGIMGLLDGAESLAQYPDLVYFYILKDSSNIQTITAYESKEYKEYTSPVIASSRGGTDVFIGEYYSHTIIEGDIVNGSSIIIIGDKCSKMFAPWLIPYYSNIILINPLFYYGDAHSIAEMIQEYNINDFLIIESPAMCGESKYNKEMNSIFMLPDLGEEE